MRNVSKVKMYQRLRMDKFNLNLIFPDGIKLLMEQKLLKFTDQNLVFSTIRQKRSANLEVFKTIIKTWDKVSYSFQAYVN